MRVRTALAMMAVLCLVNKSVPVRGSRTQDDDVAGSAVGVAFHEHSAESLQTSSAVGVTSTCCNSDGTIRFQDISDLWCLSYNCITMHGGKSAFGGFMNPDNWKAEKDQCHDIGYVTWGELKAGRPDIEQFSWRDTYDDPAYFEYLLNKYISMDILPLCGSYTVGSSRTPTNFNARQATGPPDGMYNNLIAKIASKRPEQIPSHAEEVPPEVTDAQDKGWKLPNPDADNSPGKRDTKKAFYDYEDSLESFIRATKPGRGNDARTLQQGKTNQKMAIFALFEGVFDAGGKGLEALGEGAARVIGVPGTILGNAKKMWEEHEKRQAEKRAQEMREWANDEWKKMQDEWDRQLQAEVAAKAEVTRKRREEERKEEERLRKSNELGSQLYLIENLVDRGLPGIGLKPVKDEDLPLMKKVYDKIQERLTYFQEEANKRTSAKGMSGPQVSFHAATFGCARETLECELRREDAQCAAKAQHWVSLTHGAGAPQRCRGIYQALRVLLQPGIRPRFIPGGFGVPMKTPAGDFTAQGLPSSRENFSPQGQQYIMTLYKFLREKWRGQRPCPSRAETCYTVCGNPKYDDTFCRAGDFMLGEI